MLDTLKDLAFSYSVWARIGMFMSAAVFILIFIFARSQERQEEAEVNLGKRASAISNGQRGGLTAGTVINNYHYPAGPDTHVAGIQPDGANDLGGEMWKLSASQPAASIF